MSRRPAVLVAILVPLSLTLLAPATATAARAQADLMVTKVSRTPAKARQGAVIKIASDTVRNVGTARAEASSVRYYLTRNVRRSQADRRTSRMRPRGSWLDVRLAGSRSVPALNAKASSSTRKRAATKLRIPVDAAPGSYTLLACADDRDAVTERSETNNCTAAPGKIRIIEVAPDMEVRALLDYSNYNAELTDDSIQQVLLAMRPYCKAGKLPRSMSQTAATASIRRQIQKQVGAAKMKQLDKQLTKQVGKKAAQQAAIAQRIAAAAATEG
ncbi:MAG: CARDB domain-containing protein, partial [Gaiellales bacterium]